MSSVLQKITVYSTKVIQLCKHLNASYTQPCKNDLHYIFNNKCLLYLQHIQGSVLKNIFMGKFEFIITQNDVYRYEEQLFLHHSVDVWLYNTFVLNHFVCIKYNNGISIYELLGTSIQIIGAKKNSVTRTWIDFCSKWESSFKNKTMVS